eukprot:TRINITY_DN11241_c0_g1_i2.p1 TRINITY_DN11241_c0_g1~~TRINITY_DN11241_c0_g1_i2.p1  ORF type:complete len:288 (+),score=44.86 TRINITY_DN11241_c0_g1_i2:71-865(+)
MPPVTRLWFLSSTASSLALLAAPPGWGENFVWSWNLFWRKRQWWRAISSLVFLGEAGYGLLINLYFVVQNSGDCEIHMRRTSRVAYALRLAIGASLVLAGATSLRHAFPAMGLLMYVQGLRCLASPDSPVNFFGFHTQAIYLPFICLGFHYFVEGSDVKADLLGLAAAVVVHVLLPPARGRRGLIDVLTTMLKPFLGGGRNNDPGSGAFAVGDAVVVRNLISQPQWNGLRGIIQSVLDGERYEVLLPDLDRRVSLKRACLEPPH